MGSFDLHLHTHWSYDALSTVEDYFRFAREKKLRALAITDHHLMDGYEDVLDTAEKYPDVAYLAGGELTVHCELGEFDLVCLNLPRRPTPELTELFNIYRKWQVDCGKAYSANLSAMGFDFDDEKRMRLLQSYRPAKAIAKQGNTHVRYAVFRDYCIAHGFCRDTKSFLEMREKFTDVPDYPEYDVVIPAIKKNGGVVILAHPYGYFLKTDQKRMDLLREMFMLDGIECAHPDFPPEISAIYRAYCRKHGLVSSGGSDLHTPEINQFAAHCGADDWLDELLERVAIYHGGDT